MSALSGLTNVAVETTSTAIRTWGHYMKKIYEKPVLEKRQKLSSVVALSVSIEI